MKWQNFWHSIVEQKHTTLFAGCDPKVDQDNLEEWCLRYVDDVAPYVAGIKCNPAYFQSEQGIRTLRKITEFCKNNKMLSIIDYKVSDIGSTNDAWFYFAKDLGFDMVTIAPYAGNIEQAIKSAHNVGLGVISMGLMSNPEFISEALFESGDTCLWQDRVQRSITSNVDGLVLGATYTSNPGLLEEFIEVMQASDTLLLVPGIGAQGGSVSDFLQSVKNLGIDPKRCMLSIGRGLMYPINCTHKEKAKKLHSELKESMQF
jgi:orotidine-5'-phosphate decarboxylase